VTDTLIGLCVVIALLAYQIGVSAFVYTDRELTKKQRLAQWLLIWLLPLAGAAMAHFAYKLRRANEAMPEKRFIDDRAEPESFWRGPGPDDLT